MARGAVSGRTRISAASRTDIGRVHKHNEDTVLVRPDLQLYLVADGMGGHNAGEVASALVASSIEKHLLATRSADVPEDHGETAEGPSRDADRLAGAARKANADVYELASTRREHAGMGSTLVAAFVSESERRVHICHAGDSRCYRIRNGAIEQLTRDHSLIGDALEAKPDLSPEMLAVLPKNVITRAAGTAESLAVGLRSEPLCAGDLYLLCSDGLSGLVEPEQLLETSTRTTDLEELGAELVRMANEAGGIDNISVVLFRVDEVDGVVRSPAAAEGDEPQADEPQADEGKDSARPGEEAADEPKADEPETDEPKTDEPEAKEPDAAESTEEEAAAAAAQPASDDAADRRRTAKIAAKPTAAAEREPPAKGSNQKLVGALVVAVAVVAVGYFVTRSDGGPAQVGAGSSSTAAATVSAPAASSPSEATASSPETTAAATPDSAASSTATATATATAVATAPARPKGRPRGKAKPPPGQLPDIYE